MTQPPGTAQTSSRRIDAERNRGRILAAARAAFDHSDVEVSMAQIARRADVGSATLYRNFASRRELLEALYVDEIDAVCDAATISGETPGATLELWLRRFYSYFTQKRLIAAELLEHTGADDPVFETGYDRVITAGTPLLLAARAADEVQVDLTLGQILDMVVAIAKIPGTPSYREPILRATLRALRTDTGA